MSIMKYLCRLNILSLTVLYILKPLMPIDITMVTSLLGISILILASPLMAKSFKIPTYIFFILGIFLLLITEQPFKVWMLGIDPMLNIISILVIMQLFSIPIQLGNYGSAVEFLLIKHVKKESALFLFVTVVTHILSSFLLFGTIPVMLTLMGDTLKRNVSYYERFAATSISRGYSFVVLWAPGAINILLVLQVTQAKWLNVFIPGLFLSIIGIITSVCFESKFNLSSKELQISKQDNHNHKKIAKKISAKKAYRKVFHIMAVVVSLILLITIMEKYNITTSSHRIMIAGLIIVSLWIVRYKNSSRFGLALKSYWDNDIIKTIDLVGLFVSIGIFAEAVKTSGVINILQNYLLEYSFFTGIFFIFFIPFIIVVCSLVGIHPFISLVMLGQMVSNMDTSISNVGIALALALGGSISYILSPFAGIVLTLAKFLDQKPQEICFKWNGLFSVIYLIEGVIFIYCFELIF